MILTDSVLAIKSYENRTREVIRTWLDKLKSYDGSPIDTSLYSLLITFDNMGLIGFSHSFNTIQSGKENRTIQLLEVLFGQIGKIGELVWPLCLLKDLGLDGDAPEFEDLFCKMANERDQVRYLKDSRSSFV